MNSPSLPSLYAMERMAQQVLAEIPPELARHIKTVAVHVVDFPDEEICREMNLKSPYDLLGLYQGVSLDQKSVEDLPEDLDHVYLYRRPILEQWSEEGGDLMYLVRSVVLHEIGHHFGFSDADMERICAQACAGEER